LSLRLPGGPELDLDALERLGSLTAEVREVLRAIICARVPFLITGGTGTGKSTLLAAMLAEAPATERIVVVEDVLELDIDHPHVVHLQARHANTEGAGEAGLPALVRQSLRMRPDRTVRGERRGGGGGGPLPALQPGRGRGGEARALLRALTTGHEGGCGTVHANPAADVPARLEALGALGGLDRAALAAQVASALEVVIQLGRRHGNRCLTEIALLRRGPD